MACDLVHCNAHKSSIQAKNDATKNHRLYRKGPFSSPTHHEDDRREEIRETEKGRLRHTLHLSLGILVHP